MKLEWHVMTLIKNGYHLPNKGIGGVMVFGTWVEALAYQSRVNNLDRDAIALNPYSRPKSW